MSSEISRLLLDHFLDLLGEREDDDKKREIIEKIYTHCLDNIPEIGDSYKVIIPGFKSGYQLVFNFIFGSEYQAAYFYHLPNIDVILINCYPDLENEYKDKKFKTIVEKRKYTIIHELTHFVDYINIGEPLLGMRDLINSGTEFNAYYQTIAIKYKNKIKNKDMKNFIDILGQNPNEFVIKVWREHPKLGSLITDDYKKRWNKRLAQLYYELMSHIKLDETLKIDKISRPKINSFEDFLDDNSTN